jgi:hypothetical protein
MWLLGLAGICLIGGLVLVFARDWVWSIDKQSSHFERDDDGEPIRTPTWDRNHLLLGVVMIAVALVVGMVALFG